MQYVIYVKGHTYKTGPGKTDYQFNPIGAYYAGSNRRSPAAIQLTANVSDALWFPGIESANAIKSKLNELGYDCAVEKMKEKPTKETEPRGWLSLANPAIN